MSTEINFVKGHCGWDVVTLLPHGQIPESEELGAAIKILDRPIDGGLEVGWLKRGEHANEIGLRMVNSTTKTWIPMCGGMTQVIGKALVETFFREHFDIDTLQPVVTVNLITPSGNIPIRIDIQNDRVIGVTTVMDNYLEHVYRSGIEALSLDNTSVLRVGKYVVMDLALLEQRYPDINFMRRDAGPHLDVIHDLLRTFGRRQRLEGINGMLYDRRPEGPGQYRVFPRFYSDDLAAARIPWEFQCGTGSIAVAVALAREDRLPFEGSKGEVLFEWGSYRTTPDPYGIRTSRIQVEREEGRVIRASFSHSVVEILAEGKLRLPQYPGRWQGP